MEKSTPDNRTIHEYLTALRSGSPTPGGGSAAAYAGAMGASLAAMVARLTLKSTDADTALAPAAARLDALVNELSASARADEDCYGRYRAAAALPKATTEEKQARSAAMQAALQSAAETPLLTARRAIEALDLASIVAEFGTKYALSDVHVAGQLLSAAIDSALVFVDVNISMIKDDEIASDLRWRADEVRSRLAGAKDALNSALTAQET
jgi:formiminotetrahydrofolate cyclodeaminase